MLTDKELRQIVVHLRDLQSLDPSYAGWFTEGEREIIAKAAEAIKDVLRYPTKRKELR